MGRPRKLSMSEGKRNIIAQLLEEYDIQSAQDIETALRDLLGGTIQNMLESELETQMEQSKHQDPDYTDSRNGYKPKTLKSNYGTVPIQVPQDRTAILTQNSCPSTAAISQPLKAKSSACTQGV